MLMKMMTNNVGKSMLTVLDSDVVAHRTNTFNTSTASLVAAVYVRH